MTKWTGIFKYLDDGNLVRIDGLLMNTSEKVGWLNSSGYLQTEYLGVAYMLHRIVWELHNAPLKPWEKLDHIDHNKLNNKIDNLRIATHAQNMVNKPVPKNNTTGYKWVLATPSGKFQARPNHNGKKIYAGLFDTAEEAYNVSLKIMRELHGEFVTP
jgi:hypothetical protein